MLIPGLSGHESFRWGWKKKKNKKNKNKNKSMPTVCAHSKVSVACARETYLR